MNMLIIWILVVVFSYMSYQFRITAILRGHLAALELEMNKTLKSDVHMWNSALMETYMAHNNMINNMMMLPVFAFILLILIYSCYITWNLLKNSNYGKLCFGVYWIIIVIGIMIVFLPFLFNERIRKETENEKEVLRMYRRYRMAYKRKIEKKRKRKF